MKRLFYPKLAWDGLRKNRQLSFPYLVTCIAMVAMFYILSFLSSPSMDRFFPRGWSTVSLVMTLGSFVMLLFSVLFLYYTYSFLSRRRAKEYGLLNVLGMGKRDLAKVVLWENLITACIALAGGLILGISVSKFAELGLVNMMHGTIDYRLHIDAGAVIRTVFFYALIFGLNALVSIVRTAKNAAINLIRSENVGEKPPKGNWIFALIGLILLVLAYYIAVEVSNPIEAINWFFAAVLLVIVATYLLLIAGSVKFCRILQKNKRFYYRKQHFVSVSSMAYRMKRNGAGLASICIIATMVLVMLSASVCLCFGMESSIQEEYPREVTLTAWLDDMSQMSDNNLDAIRNVIHETAQESGVTIDSPLESRYVYLTGQLYGTEVQCDYTYAAGSFSDAELRELFLLSADDYAAKNGTSVSLAPDEVLLLLDGCDYKEPVLTLMMGNVPHTYRVREVKKESLPGLPKSAAAPGMTLIVPDLASAIEGFSDRDGTGTSILGVRWNYSFNTGLDVAEHSDFLHKLSDRLYEAVPSGTDTSEGWRSFRLDDRAEAIADRRAITGSLVYIGIILSLIFLLSAVLIIYYKQISEGYEDASRFAIMQKVGMTRQEIKKSVSSQLLMVFLIPLVFAGLHLVFAFPMIQKILVMFGLTDTGLFIRTTAISFLAFCAFYLLVYRLTSNTYYRIVRGTIPG